jgi:hypothetical protein
MGEDVSIGGGVGVEVGPVGIAVSAPVPGTAVVALSLGPAVVVEGPVLLADSRMALLVALQTTFKVDSCSAVA